MTTIREVAKVANVSTATVSRILNNDPLLTVTDETRKRVVDVVNELGYVSSKKKSAKRADVNRIGLLLTISLEDETNDPYFMSIRLGIERVCEQYGMTIATTVTLGKNDLVESLKGLDGLIVVGKVDESELTEIYYENKNIVFVDHEFNGGAADCVISDLEHATKNIVNTLFDRGHKKLAYIGGRIFVRGLTNKPDKEINDVRQVVFEQMMKEKGYLQEDQVLLGDWTATSGYQLTKELVASKSVPTAIVVASDPMAIGVYRALHESGIKVPQDISVFSYDDIEAAEFLNPALSTVRIHAFEMGKTAVKLMYDRFNGRDIPLKVTIPTELVHRESIAETK